MITHENSLENFAEQVEYALDHYFEHGIRDIQTIVLGGLGGSGIGAAFAKTFYYEVADKSIEVISDYHLPNYVGKDTLLVLASYSGETEETLHMLEEGLQSGCKIICITSGGTLAATAKENSIPTYLIPPGYQPRMAFGFSCSLNLLILAEALGLDGVKDELKLVAGIYDKQDEFMQQAMQLANFYESTLKNKFVIIAERNAYPIAVRLAQQIQENAKLEAFVNILPENNHNVLESYYSSLPSNVFLLNGNSNDRNNLRFEFMKGILNKHNIPFSTISFDGAVLTEIFKTVHILDWLSIYLSDKNKANNMEVPNISELKSFLANQ